MLDTRDRGCRLAWVGSFLPELLSTLTGHHPQALELIWTRVSFTQEGIAILLPETRVLIKVALTLPLDPVGLAELRS